MKTGYSVSDAMTTKPITVPLNMTVREASKIMRDQDIGSLLVVSAEGVLAGIITAEDFVHRVTAEAKSSDKTNLSDIMTAELITIEPESDLYDAMALMREHDIFHLPVVDDEKLLKGFLTLKDVLRIEPQLFEIMSEMAQITEGGKRPKADRSEGYCEECGNYSDDLEKVGQRLLCSFCAE